MENPEAPTSPPLHEVHDEEEPALSHNKDYVYPPLTSPVGRFRLLRLISPSTSTLSYTLEEFDFNSCPRYHAVSYTWGAPVSGLDAITQARYDQRELTHCNGQNLSIGRNLYEALSRLAITHPHAYLWADAICINQGDDGERAAQVAQMGDIFATAERVIVWLGESVLYPELDDFLWLQGDKFRKCLFDIERSSENECESDIAQGLFPMRGFARFVQGKDRPDGLDAGRRWQGYDDFYSRCRWWTRAWALQEVALAQEIEMYSGTVKLDWDKLRSLNNLVQKHFSIIGACLENLNANNSFPLGRHALGMYDLRTVCLDGGPEAFSSTSSDRDGLVFNWPRPEQRLYAFFDYALTMVRPLEATDPRDKVYCVFGLINRFLPPGIEPIIPDYTISMVSVCHLVTCLLAEHAPTVSILSTKENPSRTNFDLPSWIPDYSATQWITLGRAPGLASSEASMAWKPTSWRRQVTDRRLRLQGTMIDVVDDLSAPVQDTMQFCARWGPVLRLCRRVKPCYANNQGVMETLSRTLTLNHSRVDHDQQGDCLSPIQRFLIFYLAEINLAGTRMKGRKPMVDLIEGGRAEHPLHIAMLAMLADLQGLSESYPQDWADVMLWHQRVAKVLSTPEERERLRMNWKPGYVADLVEWARSGSAEMRFAVADSLALVRSLFVTQRGYLGMGPRYLKIGDEIWLLSGGTVPYCLRKTSSCGDDERELVGEAYLHGFMDNWEVMLQKEGISEELVPVNLI